MNSLQDNSSVAYIRGDLPAHLTTWAADAGIILKAPLQQTIYCLNFNKDKLELHWFGEQNFLPISVQTTVQKRLASSNLLIRAVGKKTRVVADLSAGLGVDALTIASTGRKVYCVERCPPIAMLLFDGICRCAPELAELINLDFGDSHYWLSQCPYPLDAIYIDTMFSDKKKTAKSSKQMQILRTLAGEDPDAKLLVDRALNHNVSRVIVKKSANAGNPDIKTIAQYTGKSIRFDVFNPSVNT